MIRMHRYQDGLTGLVAFCDVCGDQIRENGYIVWASEEPRNWLVIHQNRCDPGQPIYDSSMPFDVEIIYLARSTAVDLQEAERHANTLGMIG